MPTLPGVWMARHDADLAFARGDDAGAVGADQPAVAVIQCALHPHHVEHRNALGDADDERHAGIDGLEDGIRCERRRHIDHRGVCAGFGHRVGDRVEHRQAEVRLPALARRDTADDVGAVIDGLFGMEGALRAGKALADDPGLAVHEY